jgi:hypothetical protein
MLGSAPAKLTRDGGSDVEQLALEPKPRVNTYWIWTCGAQSLGSGRTWTAGLLERAHQYSVF